MIKEKTNEVNAVKDVVVVLAVLEEYLNKKEDMPYEVVKYVVQKIYDIEKDYDATVKDLKASNSLIRKLERLYEIIGTIGTFSSEDEDKLDKTLNILDNYVMSIND